MKDIITPTTTHVIQVDDLKRLAEQINQAHGKGEYYREFGLKRYREAGEKLLLAKSKCKHGEWLPWLKANVHFSQRRAYHYMALAKLAVTASLEDEWRRISGNEDAEEEQEPEEESARSEPEPPPEPQPTPEPTSTPPPRQESELAEEQETLETEDEPHDDADDADDDEDDRTTPDEKQEDDAEEDAEEEMTEEQTRHAEEADKLDTIHRYGTKEDRYYLRNGKSIDWVYQRMVNRRVAARKAAETRAEAEAKAKAEEARANEWKREALRLDKELILEEPINDDDQGYISIVRTIRHKLEDNPPSEEDKDRMKEAIRALIGRGEVVLKLLD
jgi:hypothetical protein